MPETVRDRLQQWETPPPPGAWGVIAAALTEDRAEATLRARLETFNAPPPPAAWAAISNGLDPSAAPVEASLRAIPAKEAAAAAEASGETRDKKTRPMEVPVRFLYPYLLRYAGAAAVIAFLVWAFNQWSDAGPDQHLSTAIAVPAAPSSTTPAPETTTPPQPASALPGQPPVTTLALADDLEIAAPHKKLAAAAPRMTVTAASKENGGQQHVRLSEAVMQANPLQALSFSELPVQQKDLRYISIPATGRYHYRVSAKFASLLHQLADTTGAAIPGASHQWLQELQQQLQGGPYLPLPENLFDLLRLREMIQEKNK